MSVVAVTGASGYLGRRVLEVLEASDDVRRVIGIDVVDPEVSTRNLEFYRLDVRDPAIREVVSGADALVHLAATRRGDPEEIRDVNVGGTRSVLAAAASGAVRTVVHVSSVLVYGAHPDNDFPLTEESPLRPIRDLPSSVHAAECEDMLRDFRETHSGIRVVTLRSGIVLGPTVDGAAARAVEAPVLFGIAGYEPPLQVVHETDAARAVGFALANDIDGPYNVCPQGWVSLADAARLLGMRLVLVGYEDAARRADLWWRLGLTDCPPAHLPLRMYPWVMSGARLSEAGFRPLYSTEETLLAAAEARRGWISVGKLRFRTRRVGLGAVLAATVALSAYRRRRRTARGRRA